MCHEHGIIVEAYSPLTQGQRFGHPTVVAIARAVGRSPAQVLLRWGIQHGFVVLPKSVHRERIAENAAVFDFTLDATAMASSTGSRRASRSAGIQTARHDPQTRRARPRPVIASASLGEIHLPQRVHGPAKRASRRSLSVQGTSAHAHRHTDGPSDDCSHTGVQLPNCIL